MLDQIRRELEADPDETREISASLVRTWMANREPNVRGAMYGLLHSSHAARVNPPLSFDEVFDFVLQYFEWCIKTDPAPGGWANTRYSAGWDLVGWFIGLWDESRDKKYFEAIKVCLESLYKTGDADLRKAIEHSIVEHLFERKAIRKFFGDWKTDPVLKPAYDEGVLWVTRGGKSPLSEQQSKE